MKRTFRILSILFVFILCIAPFASADSFDLSGFSYDDLVALKNQINLAIWNSHEWQEVTVPQGVWKVGEDIPAGHWTVKCAPEWRSTNVEWGEYLDDAGEDIRWKGRYSWGNRVYNPSHKYFDIGDGITEYSFEARNGEYIVIKNAPAVFTPYAGKPSLGFK